MSDKSVTHEPVLGSGDNIAATLAEQFRALHGTQSHSRSPDGEGATAVAEFAVVPEGKTLESVEAFYGERRNGPRFHAGVTQLYAIESLFPMIERFKQPGTVVFVGITPDGAGKVDASFDFDTTEIPRHRRWGAEYVPKLSKAWTAWMQAAAREMNQAQFAAFVEDRIVDVCQVPADDALAALATTLGTKFAEPVQLMSASRGLQLSITQEVTNAVTLETGEVEIAFAEKHTQKANAVMVPRLFAVAIPLWENGALYRMGVRLRYRNEGGKVLWSVIPYQTERLIQHAADALNKHVTTMCGAMGVPVFQGVRP